MQLNDTAGGGASFGPLVYLESATLGDRHMRSRAWRREGEYAVIRSALRERLAVRLRCRPRVRGAQRVEHEAGQSACAAGPRMGNHLRPRIVRSIALARNLSLDSRGDRTAGFSRSAPPGAVTTYTAVEDEFNERFEL